MHILSNNLPNKLDNNIQKELFIELCNNRNSLIRDQLIIHNMRLVAFAVNMKFSESKEKNDLFSVGLIGLIKAVDNYNITVGEFSTFAISCIIKEILHYLRDKKDFCYMDDVDNIDLYIDYDNNFVQDIEEKELLMIIINFLDNLPVKQKNMFLAYYNSDSLTQTEIARMFNVSQQDVSKMHKKTINEIRTQLVIDKKIRKKVKI